MKVQVLKGGSLVDVVDNAFCPTGAGGGVDPTCGSGGGKGSSKGSGGGGKGMSPGSVSDVVKSLKKEIRFWLKGRAT